MIGLRASWGSRIRWCLGRSLCSVPIVSIGVKSRGDWSKQIREKGKVVKKTKKEKKKKKQGAAARE